MSKVKEHLWTEPELDSELIQVNNMHISKMSNSKYIKKEDVEKPILVTILKIEHEDISQENEPPLYKYIMYFTDYEKPLALNQTNIMLSAHALGSEESDDWIGKNIVLFNDKTVVFNGKLGGVRIRAPKTPQPVSTSTNTVQQSDPFDDDIPF